MNTKVLEYIIAVAEEKSITRAADRFYLSQPSLSRHISNIENELGAKLFRRRGGALELTDAGKIYINGAQAILRIESQANARLDELRAAGRKSLRLLFDPELMRAVRRHIREFRQRYPEVPVSVDECAPGDCEARLLAGEADLAVRISPAGAENAAGLEQRTLRREQLVLALPRGGAETGPVSEDGAPPPLPADGCFYCTPAGERAAEEIFARWDLVPRWRCIAEDGQTAAEVVERGYGCALLPLSAVRGREKIQVFPLSPPHELRTEALYRAQDRGMAETMLRTIGGFMDGVPVPEA